MTNREKGDLGEDIAAEYLARLGYEILERNYTVKGGEIDIIAKDGDTLVFVEVKTRIGSDEPGAQAVDERKCAFLVNAAERFVLEKDETAAEMKARFDLVDISFPKRTLPPDVRYCKNIIF
ncbi:MAG: YraN family protein [Ruminococcaceae bacterium]|nr:YraN family protein [Oscillospiraceae bacterium]